MVFSRGSYWLRSGFYTFMQRLGALLFGFGSFFFLVRGVSKEDFGAWALFLSVTTILELGKNGLIQNGLVKFLAADDQGQDGAIISASLFLNAVVSIIMGVIIAVLAPWLALWFNSPVLESMLYLYLISMLLLIPFSQFSFVQQANFDFKGIFFSNIFRQGILFFYILAVFIAGGNYNLNVLVLVQAGGLALGTIVAYFYSKKYFSLSAKVDWSWVAKLFHYGKYVFGTNISSMVVKSTDQIMLGVIAGPVPVASFNMASRVNNLVEVPTFTMASIVFPKSAQHSGQGGEVAVKRLYEKSVGAIMAVLLPVVAVILLFPEFIILVMAGKDYLDSVFLLQLVVFYCLFIPFSRQFGTIMDSVGKPHVNFGLICGLAVLNIGLNFFLIQEMGAPGAAIATLISYSLGFVANQYILYKLLKVNTLMVFKYMADFYREGYYFFISQVKKRVWISK